MNLTDAKPHITHELLLPHSTPFISLNYCDIALNRWRFSTNWHFTCCPRLIFV